MKAQIVAVCLWASLGLWAQEPVDTTGTEEHPWSEYLNEVMTADDADSESWEQTYETLCELEQHPLDLNKASREQLEQLPFLSARQIEELVEYRDRYGAMKSPGELMMIRSLDYNARRLLTYFIYIDEHEEGSDNRRLLRHAHLRNELMASGRIPFYQRKGDTDEYMGYPYRHWVRYQLTYGDQLKAGLIGAQDAGEPFFAGSNRLGYDYYSYYLQLRNVGRLESLVVGKYRVSLGLGLILNNGFSLGKLSMLLNLGRSAYAITAHSSRSENYLQGAAATLKLGKGLSATAFISYRAMDATLNKNGTAATILSTGYHRTESEMAKKHNLHALKAGGSLLLRRNGFHVGANFVYTHLDRKLQPNTDILYRRNYPQGTSFINGSLDYGYASYRLSVSGETAIDRHGHLATLNTLSLRLGDTWNLMALQRFYAYSYATLDGMTFSEGGRVQNESGVYLGLSWQPVPAFRLSAYADLAYFAWAKYLVSESSYAQDYLIQGILQKQRWTFTARYRLRMKQRDLPDKSGLYARWEHRGRLRAEYAGDFFGSTTQIDGGFYNYEQGERGAMVSESLWWRRHWLRLYAGGGYFRTDSYDSRVYLYERGPLYTYSMNQYYGEGIRYWVMVKADIGRHLTLTAKAGTTKYFDRDKIGTGTQQIDSSSQTDLDLQLRWKF